MRDSRSTSQQRDCTAAGTRLQARRSCQPVRVCFAAMIAVGSLCQAAEPRLELALIHADMTPQPGDAACIGFLPRIETVEHPLELKGLLLRKQAATGAQIFVVAALDYQGLCNSSDDRLRQQMAEAVGTTPDRVALQSLHQHTAPVLDLDGARLVYAGEPDRWRAHEEFVEKVAARAAQAGTDALTQLQPVTRIVATRAKVDRVASNRRIVQADGSIVFRGSGTRDPRLHAAPEGLIDPWVRTLSFFDGERLLAQVHYYATHPQSFYGDARVSWDVPGLARQRLQDETGVFQVYFTGCGGNVAMGKYNDATRAARDALAERLYQGMQASAAAARPGAIAGQKPPPPGEAQTVLDVFVDELQEADISWDIVPVRFQPREDGEFDERRVTDLLRPEQPLSTRLKAAMAAAWFDRLRRGHQVGLSRLRIGALQIVHLPGEPFVEFQLFAQQQSPESFVCVAGYGECGVWYYGPDIIFADRGGYEQTWSFAEPCQQTVEDAITKLLRQP